MGLLLTIFLLVFPLFHGSEANSERELLGQHEKLIRAHLDDNVDLWMSLEESDYVSANRGQITFPTTEERRTRRASYLERASFSTYRDARPPIVRVSHDGSLGWLIAEVEVKGTIEMNEGPQEFEQIWAWIELYQRTPAGWKMVGNVSNSR